MEHKPLASSPLKHRAEDDSIEHQTHAYKRVKLCDGTIASTGDTQQYTRGGKHHARCVMKARIKASNKQQDAKVEETAQVDQQLDCLRKKAHGLEHKNEELKTETEALRNELDANGSLREQEQRQHNDEREAMLQGLVAQAKNEKTIIEAVVESLRDENSSLSAQNHEDEAEKARMRNIIEQSNHRAQTFETELVNITSAKDQQIASLEHQLQRVNSTIQLLGEEGQSTWQKLSGENSNLQQRITGLENDCSNLSEITKSVWRENSTLQNTVGQLRQKLSQAIAGGAALEHRLNEVQLQFSKAIAGANQDVTMDDSEYGSDSQVSHSQELQNNHVGDGQPIKTNESLSLDHEEMDFEQHDESDWDDSYFKDSPKQLQEQKQLRIMQQLREAEFKKELSNALVAQEEQLHAKHEVELASMRNFISASFQAQLQDAEDAANQRIIQARADFQAQYSDALAAIHSKSKTAAEVKQVKAPESPGALVASQHVEESPGSHNAQAIQKFHNPQISSGRRQSREPGAGRQSSVHSKTQLCNQQPATTRIRDNRVSKNKSQRKPTTVAASSSTHRMRNNLQILVDHGQIMAKDSIKPPKQNQNDRTELPTKLTRKLAQYGEKNDSGVLMRGMEMRFNVGDFDNIAFDSVMNNGRGMEWLHFSRRAGCKPVRAAVHSFQLDPNNTDLHVLPFPRLDQLDLATFVRYARRCIFAQIPELQAEAAQQVLPAELMGSWLMRSFGTTEMPGTTVQKTRTPGNWENVVNELARHEAFQRACISWAEGAETTNNQRCWPPTFVSVTSLPVNVEQKIDDMLVSLHSFGIDEGGGESERPTQE